MNNALIIGISGQDGNYLTNHLLDKGYRVFGTIRRHAKPEAEVGNLTENQIKKVTLIHADLLDQGSLTKAFEISKPAEIYNLAAQAHVGISFTQPVYTFDTIVTGTLYLLELMKKLYPHSKYYQASSSEMFGNNKDKDGFIRETTKMEPVSPYGAAKLAAYNLVKIYRDSYHLFACNGILFNHESPLRGSHFVTQKVVKSVFDIMENKTKTLQLGPLDSSRDWGHAKDYTYAMWQMLQHHTPGDYICATGREFSVRELCNYVFSKFGLDYRNFIVTDFSLIRPNELKSLLGDPSYIRKTLGWQSSYTFEELIDEMIEAESARRSNKEISWNVSEGQRDSGAKEDNRKA